jgi:hypothetical protein
MAEAAQRVSDAFDVIVGIKGKLREYKTEALGQWEGNAANSFNSTTCGKRWAPLG